MSVTRPGSDLAIAGVGIEPFVAKHEGDADEIARGALLAALDDACIEIDEVDLWVFGSRFEHPAIGQRTLYPLGATGPTVLNTENACASGTLGLQIAAAYVEAGMARRAVVVGVEQASSLGASVPLPESDRLGRVGVTHPARYGLEASRYLHEHGATIRELAAVSVKNRRHAALNPAARFQTPVTIEEVIGAPPVADPFTRLHCCANADGAAALVVTAGSDAPAGSQPVPILSIATGSGPRSDRQPRASLTRRLADLAFRAAGVGADAVDVAEVYDAFAILEILSAEDLGFAEEGTAARRIAAGEFDLGTPGLVLNPGGGLLGRGHPLGASGVAQVVEIVQQLRGSTGERQVRGASVGLVQTFGGNIRELESNAGAVVLLGWPR
jgi:benzoylsuccinyl-CoA thiolase BbsB subunit